MQFLIEQLEPGSGELSHTAVVTGRSGVLEALGEVVERHPEAERWLTDVARRSEGELPGPFGVFRFAPAA